ncbi:MAG: hypothetical protein K0B81_07910 [Candidatus Cloacimonetes bacterium]|nr:hypothetical protein [Candidatus Cloacimonadota bacterium]
MAQVIHFDRDEALDLIKIEYNLHPAAELIDYYKLFYQALYGPGHLITNESEAYSYLHEELLQFQGNQEPYVQDLSLSGNDFCRVNLQVILDKMISEIDYFDLFLQSARDQTSTDGYNKYWYEIEKLIKEIGVLGKVFEEQEKILKSCLDSAVVYSPRHSDIFRQNYNPHYRLIRKIFLTDILLK